MFIPVPPEGPEQGGSEMLRVWKCRECGAENGPTRDVFCGKCGKRTGPLADVKLVATR